MSEPKDPLAGVFSADWLMEQEFPPIEFVLPGIIPQGMSFLVASPKIGKSWFVLGVAVACASGGIALGALQVDPRPVLYLALEDGKQRLQSRLASIGVTEPPADLFFVVDAQIAHPLEVVRAFIAKHADAAPLVILDTLGKVMPPANQGESSYERDYRVAGVLKAAADSAPGSAVVVVHHTRKAGAEDFLDTLSGTQGLAGAANTILAIKRERNSPTATLHVTSRDTAEGEYQMRLEDDGRWQLDGDSLADAARNAQTSRQTAGLGDRSADIVRKLDEYPEGISPRDLAIAMGMDADQTRVYLQRLNAANRVQKLARGKYAPLYIPPVSSVSSVTETDSDERNKATEETGTQPERSTE